MAKQPEAKKVDFRAGLKEYFSLSGKYAHYFAVITFFVVLGSLSTLAESYLFKVLLDNAAIFSAGGISRADFSAILFGIGAAFLFIILLSGISDWSRYYFINRLEGNLIFDLKKKYFLHILGLSHRFHTTHRTGSLIARMTRGARSIESISDFFVFNIAPLAIQLIVACISLLYFDIFSVLTIVVIMAIYLFYVLALTRRQQRPEIESNEADDREKAFVGDVFTNVDTIKYFGKEGRMGGLYGLLATDSSRLLVKSWDFQGLIEAGQDIIMGAGVALLLYSPLVKFLDGGLTIGSLVFIYTVYLSVTGPMSGFVYGVRRFYESMADFQSLIEYGRQKPEISNSPDAKELIIQEGNIEFADISFTYHKKKVIDGFSLSVSPEEKVALVGRSGSGKTTLIKLLYRLYDVDLGVILIDGKNITGLKQESLRSQLSIVPQEGVLFNDTILNNVAFSRPDASREQIMEALKAAQLYDFVDSLPEKGDTLVGERGIKLSGGERQRLSIARAILADRKVLVFDEATSSLDSVTENKIQNALTNLMKGRTTIIIAHRLSTIMNADRIIVLERGKVAQAGKHTELIAQEGLYRELWGMQKGGDIEE